MTHKLPPPKAQKWRLAETVRNLAALLERPVCSNDLRAYYREHPDEHPLLVQALGQVLFKAARPRPAPVVFRVGLIGNFAYYAPDQSLHWSARLEIHRQKWRAEREINEDLPQAIILLLDSPLRMVAANALAGFADEWGPSADDPALVGWDRIDELRRLVSVAEQERAAVFSWDPPSDTIVRRVAENLLQDEYQRRADAEHALSLYRHLANLGWLSERFAAHPGEPRFSRLQIKWYAQSKWSWDPLQREAARAITMALRYGCAGYRGPITL